MTIEGHLLLEWSLLASALSQVLESSEMAAFHHIRRHCLGWCAPPQIGYILIQLRVLELNLSLETQNEGLNFLAEPTPGSRAPFPVAMSSVI